MTRILFVDDEPRVLDGLRRSLLAKRGQWDMAFAVGGAAALEELERAPFDVLVTDMRMPEVDGLALLTAARERWPRMARIILSGYMDMEVALRSTSVAHRFLAKPCDPQELEAVVERTRRLAALLTDEALRAAAGEVGTLATRPAVFTELERVIADPGASVTDVSRIIAREVSLTAKVLQLVNSSFFGLARRVSSAEQAVNYLGVNVIRALVLSHEIGEVAGAHSLPPEFSLVAHQEHALRVASLARHIAGGGALADDAFLAGVLHDVGELLLATQRRREWFVEAPAMARARGIARHEAETLLFGTSHAEVGAYLVGLWGLPSRIVEAVAYHHLPSRLGGDTMDVLAAVHLADALVTEATTESASGGNGAVVDADHVAALGVGERLDGWRAALADLRQHRE